MVAQVAHRSAGVVLHPSIGGTSQTAATPPLAQSGSQAWFTWHTACHLVVHSRGAAIGEGPAPAQGTGEGAVDRADHTIQLVGAAGGHAAAGCMRQGGRAVVHQEGV